MRYLNANWYARAAGAFALFALAALWLLGAGTTHAGGTTGSVVITPPQATVGAGGTTTVSVDVTAPDTGLSVWIIEVAYDPDVVQVDTNAGNPVCTSPSIPGTNFAGYGCATKDTSNPADGTKDTAVAFGAWVANVGNAATGWTGTHTVATFTFRAVGAAGESSPLTISVCDSCFLGPNAEERAPTTTNGQITISAGTTRKWGDVDCGGTLSVIDARKVVLAVVGSPANQPQGCPAITDNVTITAGTFKFGDADCGGTLSVIDARKIVLAVVGSPANQPQGCPAIGSDVTVG
jgi:hypothetical protein